MSNRRYFARGTDFYRLVDEEGQHRAGPYFDMKGARYYRSYSENYARKWRRDEEYAVAISKWRIQKLVAQCSEEENSDGEFEHESWLMWLDVEE